MALVSLHVRSQLSERVLHCGWGVPGTLLIQTEHVLVLDSNALVHLDQRGLNEDAPLVAIGESSAVNLLT